MYQNYWNAEIEGNVLMPNGTFLTHTLQHVLASELTESLSFTSYTKTKLSTYPEQELVCAHARGYHDVTTTKEQNTGHFHALATSPCNSKSSERSGT